METGLKERIKKAKSTAEIKSLQREGETFKDVTPRTQRKWDREADKRTNDLR